MTVQTIVEVCENDEAVVAAREHWINQRGYSEVAGVAVSSECDVARASKRKDGSATQPTVRIKAVAAAGSKVRVLIFKGDI